MELVGVLPLCNLIIRLYRGICWWPIRLLGKQKEWSLCVRLPRLRGHWLLQCFIGEFRSWWHGLFFCCDGTKCLKKEEAFFLLYLAVYLMKDPATMTPPVRPSLRPSYWSHLHHSLPLSCPPPGTGTQGPGLTPWRTRGTSGGASPTCKTWSNTASSRSTRATIGRSESTSSRCRTLVMWMTCEWPDHLSIKLQYSALCWCWNLARSAW